MEKRIGFGKRLGAYLLDMVVIYVLSFIVGTLGGSAIFMAIMGTADTNNMENDAALGAVGGILAGAMAAVAGVLIISVVIYLIEGLTGVTPGKAILGLKVGNKEGKVASSSELLTRFLAKVSGTLLTILGGITGVAILGTIGGLASLAIFIGCFMVLGSEKQALHDMVGKTAVFNKADLVA